MTTDMSATNPNKAERARMIDNMRAALRAIEALPPLTPCAECLHFDNGHCARWAAAVPEDARSLGCAEWEEQIPF